MRAAKLFLLRFFFYTNTKTFIFSYSYTIIIIIIIKIMVNFSLSTSGRIIGGGGVEVQLPSFLTLVPDGHDWLTTPPGRFIHMKEHRNHLIGGCVGFRDGRDLLEKRKSSFPYRDSNPGPFRQQHNNNNKYLLPLTSSWRKPSRGILTIQTYQQHIWIFVTADNKAEHNND